MDKNAQFATLDHIEGDKIKLKRDQSGQHHYIPFSWAKNFGGWQGRGRPGGPGRDGGLEQQRQSSIRKPRPSAAGVRQLEAARFRGALPMTVLSAQSADGITSTEICHE